MGKEWKKWSKQLLLDMLSQSYAFYKAWIYFITSAPDNYHSLQSQVKINNGRLFTLLGWYSDTHHRLHLKKCYLDDVKLLNNILQFLLFGLDPFISPLLFTMLYLFLNSHSNQYSQSLSLWNYTPNMFFLLPLTGHYSRALSTSIDLTRLGVFAMAVH